MINWVLNAIDNRPSAVRRRRAQRVRLLGDQGLSERDVERLATYNSRIADGVVHTADAQAEFAELQRRFDAYRSAWAAEEGAVIV